MHVSVCVCVHVCACVCVNLTFAYMPWTGVYRCVCMSVCLQRSVCPAVRSSLKSNHDKADH